MHKGLNAVEAISAVDVVLVHADGIFPPFSWRDGLPGSEGPSVGGWLVISTDHGTRGFAYCPRGEVLNDMVDRRIRTELLGADPLHREHLWQRMWELDRVEEFPIYIQGAVDVALWDIAGKIAGEPVYRLLGESRSVIDAYASTVTFGSVAEYLDVADQCLALNYRAIKLHAWGDVRRDIELAQALRNHVGSEVELMFDGSAGYDLLDATRLGKALADLDFLWFEEPMREFNVTAYARLAERVTVPLLVAETSDGAHMNSADFVAAGCAAGLRVGANLRAGITGSMKTAALAESFLLRAEVHGGGLPNVHLCMALSNCTYFESLVISNPVRLPSDLDSLARLRAPTGPGIGWEDGWDKSGWPVGLDRVH